MHVANMAHLVGDIAGLGFQVFAGNLSCQQDIAVEADHNNT